VLPTRESELVELTRDYTTLQTAYANLLMKRENSVIAANLERRQIGEQFKLLDAASLPEKPYNQRQRLGIMASGAGVGVALGLVLIAMLELLDSSFRSKEEVIETLSVPVLASIPMMRSDRERRSVKWRHLAMDVAGALIMVAAAAVLVVWRLRS
jgi:capsular polysaccharide biosynthesis protein